MVVTGVTVGVAIVAVVAALMLAWLAVSAARRSLDARLGVTDAELRRLGDAAAWRDRGAEQVHREISDVRSTLQEFRAREEERRAREEEGWATLQRVSAVLAGSHRTGRAGENVLREAFAHLPPSMIVTDFRVNGRVVEFGLVLPDGRTLPIDSKWPAERELRSLADAPDQVERERLIRVIERTVSDRAREVAGYRDPAVTTSVAVAAIPDAAYSVLRRAHAEAYRQGVIVIGYSMALPAILFLHSIVSRFGSGGDVEACLTDLAAMLDAMMSTVENKVVRASTMLGNGAEELRGQIGRARASVARARDADGSIPVLEPGGPAAGGDGELIGRARLVGLPP